MVEIEQYYGKLAANQVIGENDIVALLVELKHYRQATAYLASCQAATVQCLPKSASNSSRRRLVSICDQAVQLIDGSSVYYAGGLPQARQRCIEASATAKVNGVLQ